MARDVSRRDFIAGAGATAGSLAMLGLSACGKADQAAGGSQSDADTYKGQQAVPHLDEIISASTFKIADAMGYFKDAKLDVKAVSFPGGADVVRALQSKMAFGQAATIPLIIAHEKGLKDFRLLSGSYYDPEVVFLAKKGSPLKTPADLKGKKIGVSEPGSNSTYFATKMLEDAGLKPGEDAKVVSIGGPADASTALDHGVIDLGWSTAPLSTKEIKAGTKQLFMEASKLEPTWVSTGLATRQQFIDSNPKTLKRWVGAVQKSMDLIHSNPKKAGEVWGKSIDIDPEIATAALVQYKDAFKLTIDREALEANVRAGKALGQLKSDPDLDQIVNDQFLPAGSS